MWGERLFIVGKYGVARRGPASFGGRRKGHGSSVLPVRAQKAAAVFFFEGLALASGFIVNYFQEVGSIIVID